jgi:hypothetical protein
MGTVSKIRNFLESKLSENLFIFSVTLFFWLPALNSDVDPHHDGYVFAQGVAISQGYSPGSEIFTQYGLVQMYLLGLVIKIFGSYIILVKLLAYIIHLIIIKQIFKIFKNFEITYGYLISLLYVVTAHFLSPSQGINLQWVSTIFASLTLLNFQLLFNYINGNQKYFLIFNSIINILLFLTRPQFALVNYLVLFVILVLLKSVNKKKIISNFIIYNTTLILFVISSLMIFQISNILYENIIVFPRNFYVEVFPAYKYTLGMMNYIFFQLGPLLIVILIFAIVSRYKFKNMFFKRIYISKYLYVFCLNILFAVSIFILFNQIKNRPPFGYLILLMIIGYLVYILPIYFALVQLNLIGKNLGKLAKENILIVSYLVAMVMLNLYSGLDYGHVWLASSNLIVAFFMLIKIVKMNSRFVSITLCLVLSFQIMKIYEQEQTYFSSIVKESNSIFWGMAKTDLVDNLQNYETIVKDVYSNSSSNSAVYLCVDGLVSVLDGNFRSSDSMFVDWPSAYTKTVAGQRQKTINLGPLIFVCANNKAEAVNLIENFSKTYTYEMVSPLYPPLVNGQFFTYRIFVFDKSTQNDY